MERPESLPAAMELLSVEELRVALRADGGAVWEFIELGLAAPCAGPGGAPYVTTVEAERLTRAMRLARELELHPAGAALLVDLLEERERLLRRLSSLESLAGPSP